MVGGDVVVDVERVLAVVHRAQVVVLNAEVSHLVLGVLVEVVLLAYKIINA